MRVQVRAAVTALLLVGAPACGGGDDETPAAQAPTTTATAPAGCPPVAAPGPGPEATMAPGDFDGDTRPDRLLTWRTAAGGPWRIRAELAAGGGAETELPATAEGVKAVGGARLDVGPAEAAFAVVGQGGAGVNLGLFVLRNCRLERVTAGGRPAEFPVGSAPDRRTGLACQVPGLVAYQATSGDGRFFQGSTVAYLLVGVILDEANRSTATLGADAPDLARYGAFSCGPLTL